MTEQMKLLTPEEFRLLNVPFKNEPETRPICFGCFRFKEADQFYPAKNRKNGHLAKCKDCTRKYLRGRHEIDKQLEKIRNEKALFDDPKYINRYQKSSRKYYASEYGKARNLWLSAKKSKTAKKRPFTLTFEHVLIGVKRGTCAVTGLPFDLKPHPTRYRNSHAPSLDRIDNNGPYSDENVRVILMQLNTMKGEITDTELYSICKAFTESFEHGY
jgi:hypothetical protein